jgi:hypothetical protein
VLSSTLTLIDVSVRTSDAGAGGDGAPGQRGQPGGAGGAGLGCPGGAGAPGGDGAIGGGGAGGISVAVVYRGQAPVVYRGQTQVELDQLEIELGNPGLGGDGGGHGKDGVAQASLQIL